MTLVRRQVTVQAGSVALHAAVHSTWLSHPIRLGGPFTPGGTTDLLPRAPGQPVIVDNKPCAGGNIGSAVVAKATDGHTLLMSTVGAHAINASLYPKLP